MSGHVAATRLSGPARALPIVRKPTKADVSRERVLAAAARIFVDRGYAGTTMRAVAEACGLQAASLYYHFRSKEDLIGAVLDMGINGVSEAVRHALAAMAPGATGRERIDVAIQAHLTSIMTFGDYTLASRRVLGQVPGHVRRRHVRLRDGYGDFWIQLLQEARDAGELRRDVDLPLARTFILGALNSALEWYKPQGKALAEVGRQFSLVISGGIFARS